MTPSLDVQTSHGKIFKFLTDCTCVLAAHLRGYYSIQRQQNLCPFHQSAFRIITSNVAITNFYHMPCNITELDKYWSKQLAVCIMIHRRHCGSRVAGQSQPICWHYSYSFNFILFNRHSYTLIQISINTAMNRIKKNNILVFGLATKYNGNARISPKWRTLMNKPASMHCFAK